MRLVVISQPTLHAEEAALTASLFRAGLSTYHLRKPGCSRPELCRLLDAIPREFHPLIMMHQHHELIQEGYQLKLDELEAPGWGPGLDYAFLSPIFDSLSKPGYSAAGFEERRLTKALRKSSVPVVALGGITAGRVEQAAGMGFAGVAVLGAVWQAEDPVEAMQELQRACNQ